MKVGEGRSLSHILSADEREEQWGFTPFPSWNLDLMVSCIRCGKPAFDKHHVVYEPDEVVVPLCRPCHRDITTINTKNSFKFRKPLTLVQRRKIFDYWLVKWRSKK